MLSHQSFFQRNGLRLAQHLNTPPSVPSTAFALPQHSVVHHSPENPLLVSDHDPAFTNYRGQIFLHFNTEMDIVLGNPVRRKVSLLTQVGRFFAQNHRFRKINALTVVAKNGNNLATEDYSLLNLLCVYPKSEKRNPYYRWFNRNAVVCKRIKQAVFEAPLRTHFIFSDIPRLLTPRSILLANEENLLPSAMRYLTTPEHWFVYEIWRWLGIHRSKTLFGVFSNEELKKIDVVFNHDGRNFILNLGLLNSWRESTEEEKAVNADAVVKGLKPTQIQNRFLRLLLSIQAKTSDACPVIAGAAIVGEDAVEEEMRSGVEQGIKGQSVYDRVNDFTGRAPVSIDEAEAEANKSDQERPDYLKPDAKWTDFDTSEEFEAELESDLAHLEEIASGFIDRHAKVLELRKSVMGGLTSAEIDKVVEIETAENESVAVEPATVEETILPATAIVHEHPEISFDREIQPPEDGVIRKAQALAQHGNLTPGEVKRLHRLAESYKTIKAPVGNETLETYTKITPELLKFDQDIRSRDNATVFDKSMLDSTLKKFDKKYIEEVMHRDMCSMILHVQNAGYAVTDLQHTVTADVTGAQRVIDIKITPVEGVSSSQKIIIPEFNEEGIFTHNNVKYRSKKQVNSLPIRKIGPDRIALTSYYGKTFVTLNEKVVNNYAIWLSNKITGMGHDAEDDKVTNLQPAKCFDNLFEAPRVYCYLSMNLRSFRLKFFTEKDGKRTTHKADFVFDHEKRKKELLYGLKDVNMETLEEKTGMRLCGRIVGTGDVILVDSRDDFYLVEEFAATISSAKKKEDGSYEHVTYLGRIEDLLRIDNESLNDAYDTPIEFTQLHVLKKVIPTGFVLGYLLGFSKLLDLLKVKPRRVKAGKRINLSPYEYAIRFNDETLVFNKGNRLASLFLAGFKEYRHALVNYSVYMFDSQNVYRAVIEANGGGVKHMREIESMSSLFVDPITRDLLIEMGEPTDLIGLIIRCTQMLMQATHPDENDPKYDRYRGYERIPGTVYNVLINAIRQHASRPGRARAQIDLNPYEAWKAISTDSALAIPNEINPIQYRKEVESVTFGGVGGRSSRMLTKSDRKYHNNHRNAISEATVDSSDVGYNIYFSANPQLTSLRGRATPFSGDAKDVNPAALLSTTALLCPFTDRDDPKRVMFASIQRTHLVTCEGYHPMPVRTGMESQLTENVGEMFALVAEEDGVVYSRGDKGIVFEYASGKRKGYELGRRFGRSAGMIVPHELVSDFVEGQKFVKGDVLFYNTGFYTKDLLEPNVYTLKASMLCNVVLWEANPTYEDSSVISDAMSERAATKISHERNIVVKFEEGITDLVKIGDEVESGSILCVLQGDITTDTSIFSEDDIESLKALSASAPKAKHKGVVEHIEVFYHGDKSDMSDSLKKIADTADKQMLKLCKETHRSPMTCQVADNMRVDGNPLAENEMLVRIYITERKTASVGDKGGFANQLKTVIGQRMSGKMMTESGIEIDAQFGRRSIQKRIVENADMFGTTALLVMDGNKEFANIALGIS